LYRCVIWDNVYIKKGARITDSVICNNVSISQGVTIDERAIIADDTSIGEEVHIKSDVKIWPKNSLKAEPQFPATLFGEKWKKSLFEGAMIKGLTNIELTLNSWQNLGAHTAARFPRKLCASGRDANRSSRMLKQKFSWWYPVNRRKRPGPPDDAAPDNALQTENLR
jgi:mannose-1-phosphate guanylyltransferase/phosphomannomutase